MNNILSAILAATLTAWSAGAAAQAPFPAKPMRLITLTPAGGALDILARLTAQRLAEQMGQPVVVENRVGAGGNLGADVVAKSAPDGYTIGMNTSSTHGINPTLYGAAMPFDAIKDFAPIAQLAELKNVTVVTPSLPVKSIPDLIQYGKANPNKLSFGSAGSGTSQHLSGELFRMRTGVQMQHVPYKGAAQAVPDLLSGQIQLMFVSIPDVLPHIRSGKLRAIAVTTKNRSSVLPDVAPIAEQGVDFDVSAWFGLVSPAGTPRPIVMRYYGELAKAYEQQEVRAKIAGLGMDPVLKTPDQFAQFIRDEIARWAPVVKASGAKAD
jgi:tripartite-type tricarboxylate transporter receptor subunit TctC